LFRLGIYEKQGELKGSWRGASLTLRQVGPGVFFALFGVGIASLGLTRHFEASYTYTPALSGSAYLTAPPSGTIDSQAGRMTAISESVTEVKPASSDRPKEAKAVPKIDKTDDAAKELGQPVRPTASAVQPGPVGLPTPVPSTVVAGFAGGGSEHVVHAGPPSKAPSEGDCDHASVPGDYWNQFNDRTVEDSVSMVPVATLQHNSHQVPYDFDMHRTTRPCRAGWGRPHAGWGNVEIDR